MIWQREREEERECERDRQRQRHKTVTETCLSVDAVLDSVAIDEAVDGVHVTSDLSEIPSLDEVSGHVPSCLPVNH